MSISFLRKFAPPGDHVESVVSQQILPLFETTAWASLEVDPARRRGAVQGKPAAGVGWSVLRAHQLTFQPFLMALSRSKSCFPGSDLT